MAVARFVRSVGPLTEALPVSTSASPVPAAAYGFTGTAAFTGATPPPGPTPTFDTLFMPRADIEARGTGPAWNRLLNYANGGQVDRPNISDQNGMFQTWLLANALVWAKTGDATNRSRVVNGVRDSIGTEDIGTSALLGPTRTLPATIIAASVVGMDPDATGTRAGYANTRFRSWLRTMWTKTIPGHSKWNTCRFTAADSATNWGAASRISEACIIRYLHLLGDATDAEWAGVTARFRRFLGDRNFHEQWGSPNGVGENFQPSWVALEPRFGASLGAQSTAARLNNYLAIGLPADEQVGGLPYDGVVVTDICRDSQAYNGNYTGQTATGVNYSWGVLEYSYCQALIHHYAGQNPWAWSSESLRRMLRWLDRAGENPQRQYDRGHHVPFLANAFYGSNYTTPPAASHGRCMGWTDWLYGGAST